MAACRLQFPEPFWPRLRRKILQAGQLGLDVGVAAGINSLGTEAELEGKKARAFPLRFVDGAVFLGPLKVGQVPPLF